MRLRVAKISVPRMSEIEHCFQLIKRLKIRGEKTPYCLNFNENTGSKDPFKK